jgi:DNA-binding PadR family transcriptional regulator
MTKKYPRKRDSPGDNSAAKSPNSSEEIKPISNSAVIVLGLLAEAPAHPYDLNKKLDERGYRNWTSIGFSSIYSILRGLEKEGLVEVREEVVESRTRTIYDLTPLGRSSLVAEVTRILIHPARPIAEWDLGIAYMFRLLSHDEQIQALQAYRQQVQEGIAFLEGHVAQFPTDNLESYSEAYHIRALFERPIYISRAEIAFVDDLIARIQQIKEYMATSRTDPMKEKKSEKS